jgi:voltage-gated potassium channel
VFGIDYLARLGLSEQRWRWFYTNLPSLVILILPMLRPLRLLRLVTLIGVLNRTGSHSLRGKVAVYATGGVVLLVVCGALAITDAERGQPDAMIQGFGDGLWWAVTTITTVGYGDTFPLTTTGRIVAACLMAGGMALLGVVTAMLASWLVEQVDDSKAQSAANVQIVELERKIDELAEEIRREGGRCAS